MNETVVCYITGGGLKSPEVLSVKGLIKIKPTLNSLKKVIWGFE